MTSRTSHHQSSPVITGQITKLERFHGMVLCLPDKISSPVLGHTEIPKYAILECSPVRYSQPGRGSCSFLDLDRYGRNAQKTHSVLKSGRVGWRRHVIPLKDMNSHSPSCSRGPLCWPHPTPDDRPVESAVTMHLRHASLFEHGCIGFC
jgi:hypothetical protein